MSHKTVLGIIRQDNKILLIKRKDDDGILWAFPGGTVEVGETDKDAVIREVMEETGVSCIANKLLGERLHPTTKVVIAYWLCDYQSGEPIVNAPDEIDEVAWIEKEEIIEKLGPTLFEPVRKYLYND